MDKEKLYMIGGFLLFGISGYQAWAFHGGVVHWLGGLQFVGSVVYLAWYLSKSLSLQQMMPALWVLWAVGLVAWMLDFSRGNPAFIFALLLWGLALQDDQRKSRTSGRVKHKEISRS
ncbi:hypothetical protein [Deinococcus cellulosilyticus]|uniref:Uncharacterized protein n=1 Tax=Deinococcus cellulosilyticus (strain DSM 18568 / NBRC 106333 / KACC 11606 / 5516J-15) TaxID=1223518 RepID=A0A511N863_DEIC1|nr:hypothetical protein [Deinococcus cellulosilyticus]GEM49010.1 hypothetical protein DC3_46450 [Deinococcus cellulosilyticus NBRC 106333 = KACC 11606]